MKFGRRSFLMTSLFAAAGLAVPTRSLEILQKAEAFLEPVVPAAIPFSELYAAPSSQALVRELVEAGEFGPVINLSTLTMQALRLFKEIYEVPVLHATEDDMRRSLRFAEKKLGDSMYVVEGSAMSQMPEYKTRVVSLDEQYSIQLYVDSWGRRPLTYERDIVPAVHQLAHNMARKSVNVFGALALPAGCEYATVARSGGLSLRGIQHYDLMSDRYQVRFDMLGGKL